MMIMPGPQNCKKCFTPSPPAETKRPDFRPASTHTSTKLKSSVLTSGCRIPLSNTPSTYRIGGKPLVPSTGYTGDNPKKAGFTTARACGAASPEGAGRRRERRNRQAGRL